MFRFEANLAEERERVRILEARIKDLEREVGEARLALSSTAVGGVSAAGGPMGVGLSAGSLDGRSSGVAAGGGEVGGGRDPQAAAGGGGGISPDAAAEMLAMMEGQLGRLSEMIRQRDAEVCKGEVWIVEAAI